MSNFVNDTLQKQIKRGEIFWCGAIDSNGFIPTTNGSDNIIEFAVETGAKECFCNVEVLCEATTGFGIIEGASSVVSTDPRDVSNMKRSDTTTVMNTTVDQISSYVGGLDLWGLTAVYDGNFPQNSPLNLEAGMLLKANTIYVYRWINMGIGGSQLTINLFLREI